MIVARTELTPEDVDALLDPHLTRTHCGAIMQTESNQGASASLLFFENRSEVEKSSDSHLLSTSSTSLLTRPIERGREEEREREEDK